MLDSVSRATLVLSSVQASRPASLSAARAGDLQHGFSKVHHPGKTQLYVILATAANVEHGIQPLLYGV